MRIVPFFLLLTIPTVLTGCVSGPPDARNDGFLAGMGQLASGGYQRQTEAQQAQLDMQKVKQVEAQTKLAQAQATLAQERGSLDALRSDTSRMDQKLKALRARLDRMRAANGVLSDKDRQLMNGLTEAKLHLDDLKLKLQSPGADGEYDDVKGQHDKLQASIAVLSQQLTESSAQ